MFLLLGFVLKAFHLSTGNSSEFVFLFVFVYACRMTVEVYKIIWNRNWIVLPEMFKHSSIYSVVHISVMISALLMLYQYWTPSAVCIYVLLI